MSPAQPPPHAAAGPGATDPATIDPKDLAGRLAAARASARDRGLDALLLAAPESLCYLTGLNHLGHFALTLLIVPSEGPPLLVARQMEAPTLAAQVPDCLHVPYGDGEDPAQVAAAAVERATAPGATVGVELTSMFLPVAVWERLRPAVTGRAWEAASGLVDALRLVKSEAEIALIRRAAAISDRAVQAGIAAAGTGVTERQVAAAVARELVLAGSEPPGTGPFIRTTDVLDQEHVTWGDRVLTPGSGLLLELSGSLARYHAPLSRMVHAGRLPAGVEAAAETSLAGLDAVTRALRPGVRASTVYEAWRQAVADRLGHDRYQRHHCGYVIGIGFSPTWTGGPGVVGLRGDSHLEITTGMTFHVFSWILGQDFPQGRGDYCVSDTALVTAGGCELLTTTPRTPLTVP